MKTAKKEFEDLIYKSMRLMGLDELSSKLIGILYGESELTTLEKLAEKTNYSLSAVSAAMKFLTSTHIVHVTKKGGSKKLYFCIQRDMMEMTLNQIKMKNERMVVPALQQLPELIERCKKSKNKDSRRMQGILEQHYKQMLNVDKMMKKLVEFTKLLQKEANK